MFGYYDRITLSLVNGADVNGKSVPFSLKLPITDENFEIPSDLASVDVFEYQEGFNSGGTTVFSIYVGERTTIEQLVDKKSEKHLKLRDEIEIPAVDSPICYQIVGDNRLVYANVDDEDVVVQSHDELRAVIGKLSTDYGSFCEAAEKIKTFGKRLNEQ